MSGLDQVLRQLEATEANLSKLENLWSNMEEKVPDGIVFGENGDYERWRMAYERILDELPEIDGWKPDEVPRSLDAIAQARLDARELADPYILSDQARWEDEPGKQLRQYRFEFDQKRKELVRQAASDVRTEIEGLLRSLAEEYEYEDPDDPDRKIKEDSDFQRLEKLVSQLETLLGSLPRPNRWADLRRHLRFGELKDLHDIIVLDWPEVTQGLQNELYGTDEPSPVDVTDLDDLAESEYTGSIATGLDWGSLSSEEFERLMFALIRSTDLYENPRWLMNENAPDRGRDMSVELVTQDELRGTKRERVIIQCRHWRSRSISPGDVAELVEKMRLWDDPPVDHLIIATTGRFTADAVALIESRNQSERLQIEAWPESHLEKLLSRRPDLIAQFGLRGQD